MSSTLLGGCDYFVILHPSSLGSLNVMDWIGLDWTDMQQAHVSFSMHLKTTRY